MFTEESPLAFPLLQEEGEPATSRPMLRLTSLLERLNLTTEDLEAHDIDVRELAHILELPWYARIQRWLVYDETIRKFLLLLLSRDKNIVEADTALLNITSERRRTQVESITIPLLNHHTKPNSRCCSLSAFAHWCGSHFYPQSNSFLLTRARALKKAFFIHGLVNGIETITMQADRMLGMLLSAYLYNCIRIDIKKQITHDLLMFYKQKLDGEMYRLPFLKIAKLAKII